MKVTGSSLHRWKVKKELKIDEEFHQKCIWCGCERKEQRGKGINYRKNRKLYNIAPNCI